MTIEEFRASGKALFGPERWIPSYAKALGISRQHCYNLVALPDGSAIRPTLALAVEALIKRKREELSE